MESEDETHKDHHFEEISDLTEPSRAVRVEANERGEEDEDDGDGGDEGESEEEDDGDGGDETDGEEEEDGEDGDEEEDGDEQSGVNFEGAMNPLDFVEGNINDVQLYQKLQRMEYEAETMKKRKGLELSVIQGQGTAKKPRQEAIIGATREEVAEVFNFGIRRRSKKQKKRGRRKGSRNNLSPEITKKMGDATLHYAHGHYDEAIILLKEVVLMAPNLPDPYHTLGLVYNSKGMKKKATDCYMIAAFLSPKESPLWKLLVTWSIEQGNTGQAWYCLSKAINADPTDISLRYRRASLFMEAGNHLKAAESYDQIVQICPNNVEALKKATMLYKQCGQFERSINILEDYLKNNGTDVEHSVIDMMASFCMEKNDYVKALQHIGYAETACCSEGGFPLYLTIKKGICHAHLGNIEEAEACFSLLERENAEHQGDLMIAVADSFVDLQRYQSALKFYLMLEGCAQNNVQFHAAKGLVSLKIAHCYSSLKEGAPAIQFFYKALYANEGDVDARLTLASLLFEENRVDEAIALLSPPVNTGPSEEIDACTPAPWWLNVKVKLKLSQLYKSKGMLGDFVEVIYPIVYESMKIDSMKQKAKQRKRLSKSVLLERVKILGDQSDSVFGHFRRPASKNDLLKANRAKKKLLEKRASGKEEKVPAGMASGLEWESDDSEEEIPQQPLKEPPWPDFLKDEEHYDLISDLCRALTSLRRYSEALELVTLTLKISYRTLSVEKKENFWSLGAHIAMNITDPSDGFDYVRYIVQQRPQSKAAWNCYYRLVLRLENRLSKHNKFLHHMRVGHKDLVPPMIISGNQFTLISQHQVAAREYLEAFKQMPESPLINLCAGTALVNLALGHRLQNKHHCVAQGLAFLYNNLNICENSQEALYNLARACHHVGLVTLAASYYEKVLAIRQEDLPLPELIKVQKDPIKDPRPGYCDLRREAAYNLHLIYKNSGAIDLARQILKDYCTL